MNPPETSWTGSPVRPHPESRGNGAEGLEWGKRRERLPLKWPFTGAVEGFRKKALANPSYDPASIFVWGTMMAVGLIEMLKAVETEFGERGHDLARDSLTEVGRRIASEMIDGIAVPDDLTPNEVASLYASWVNEVVYASIERPSLTEAGAEFDIHYCPHEDVYGAFDCRVQRYFVQGMIEAGREFFGGEMFDVAFATTIPSGSSTCHFDIYPKPAPGTEEWSQYSNELKRRALRIVQVTNGISPE